MRVEYHKHRTGTDQCSCLHWRRTDFALLGFLIRHLGPSKGSTHCAEYVFCVLSDFMFRNIEHNVAAYSIGCWTVVRILALFNKYICYLYRIFVFAYSVCGVQASAISYLGEFHSNRTRAKHLTFAAMFMTMVVAYQGLMGIFVMPRQWEFLVFGMLVKPWRIFIFIGSCTSAVAFVAIYFLPESPKFLLSMGEKDEALEILRTIYAANRLGKSLVNIKT